MSITHYAGDRFTGLSTDTKPSWASAGSVFYELDTHRLYQRQSSEWQVWLNNSEPDLTTATYTYANGLVTSIVGNLAGETHTVSYTYDETGALTQRTVNFLGYTTTCDYVYSNGDVTGVNCSTVINS